MDALLREPDRPDADILCKTVVDILELYGWSMINNKYHRIKPIARVDNFRHPFEVAFDVICAQRARKSRGALGVLRDKNAGSKYQYFQDFHRLIEDEKLTEAVENTLWRDKVPDAAFVSVWARNLGGLWRTSEIFRAETELPVAACDPRIPALVDLLFNQPRASEQGSFSMDLQNSLLGLHVRLGGMERFIESDPEAVSFHQPYYLDNEPAPEIRSDIDLLVKGVLDPSVFQGKPAYLDACVVRLFDLWIRRNTDKRVPWGDNHLIEFHELGDTRKMRVFMTMKDEVGEVRRPVVLFLGNACVWVHDVNDLNTFRIYKTSSAAHALSIWLWLVVNRPAYHGSFASLGKLPVDAISLFTEHEDRPKRKIGGDADGRKRLAPDGHSAQLPPPRDLVDGRRSS